MTGFEPATLRSQSGCATKLRYIPAALNEHRPHSLSPSPSQAAVGIERCGTIEE